MTKVPPLGAYTVVGGALQIDPQFLRHLEIMRLAINGMQTSNSAFASTSYSGAGASGRAATQYAARGTSMPVSAGAAPRNSGRASTRYT